MTFEIIFVLLALLGMVVALALDKMRPGMVLFSVVVLFLCAGILTPKEMLEGFSNKGMITVAMLFLVSEGIRQSGALGQVIKKLHGTQSAHTHIPYCPAADFPLPMLLHKKSPAVPASSVMFHSVRSHFPVPYNPESLFSPVFLNRFRLL